ncbi:MAG: aminoacyl-histidine dipeptidase [Clostridiales bacterium]|nr:aminoacyl-histidine dipeptidase [Clostridiales bacterium]
MGVLDGREPARVLSFFEEICAIPHGSGNTGRISDYLVDFAKQRNLRCSRDKMGNVIIWKDATPGHEDALPVILQGHMDMVAVKVDGCVKDMEAEGLDLAVDGDKIYARGTSLGGDDGIAVAYALAVLDDENLVHPPIEAVFTVDEEIGMLGASGLDASGLKGRMLLNIDSEEEGIFTVSCAGGATAVCELQGQPRPMMAPAIVCKVDGLTGGHSGAEIHKGRANANIVMARILLGLSGEDIYLASISGGEKDNAIPVSAEAVVAVADEGCDSAFFTEAASEAVCETAVKSAVASIERTFAEIKSEYQETDPDMRLSITVEDPKMRMVLNAKSTWKMIAWLNNVPNGICRMNPQMEGMVQTSLNLGVVRSRRDLVQLTFAVRSASGSEKQYLLDKLCALTEAMGGLVKVSGEYPGWEYRADSKLRDTMVEAYREQYGAEPRVEGIHAGLECGIFASKLEGLDAVSFGPQMQNIHTVNEELSVSSVERTWKLLLAVLQKLA